MKINSNSFRMKRRPFLLQMLIFILICFVSPSLFAWDSEVFIRNGTDPSLISLNGSEHLFLALQNGILPDEKHIEFYESQDGGLTWNRIDRLPIKTSMPKLVYSQELAKIFLIYYYDKNNDGKADEIRYRWYNELDPTISSPEYVIQTSQGIFREQLQACWDGQSLYAVWNETKEGDDAYVNFVRIDHPSSGSPKMKFDIPLTRSGDHDPGIACDPKGHLMITYSNNRGDILGKASYDYGNTWIQDKLIINNSFYNWRGRPQWIHTGIQSIVFGIAYQSIQDNRYVPLLSIYEYPQNGDVLLHHSVTIDPKGGSQLEWGLHGTVSPSEFGGIYLRDGALYHFNGTIETNGQNTYSLFLDDTYRVSDSPSAVSDSPLSYAWPLYLAWVDQRGNGLHKIYFSKNLNPEDASPPRVKITYPTFWATYSTNDPTIDLRGTASDNKGVLQVTWSNNRGGSGTAVGRASWRVSGIALFPGENIITVTAWDTEGDTGSDSLMVTYIPNDITLISPNGGEVWITGTTQMIQWTYTGNLGTKVKIELYKGDILDQTIASSVSIGADGVGSYPWSISINQTPGNDYKIRVTSKTNPYMWDRSDVNFTIISSTGCPGDLGELNDTFGSAYPLSCNAAYSALICFPTDVDYYKVIPNATGTLTITMTPPSDRDYELFLYNSNQEEICSSTRMTGIEEKCEILVTAGQTYYIKVIGGGGNFSNASPYVLTVTCSTQVGCPGDFGEPNGSFGSAFTLSCNSAYTAKICSALDVDYYKVNLTSAVTFVEITMQPPSNKDYELYIYNPSQQLLSSSIEGPGKEEICQIWISGMNFFYIKVEGVGSTYSDTTPYRLNIRCVFYKLCQKTPGF